MKIRVYYEDTDAGGIVYHTNYLKFCERARSELFFKFGKNFSEDFGFVVAKIEAKFIKPAKLGDLLVVKSKLTQIRRASISVNQQIFFETEPASPIFSADIELAHISQQRLAKIPDEVLDFLKSNLLG